MAEGDKQRGLYEKWDVTRIVDPEQKHTNCELFVLDIDHDPFAIRALATYIEACKEEYPKLADDLRIRIQLRCKHSNKESVYYDGDSERLRCLDCGARIILYDDEMR